MASKFECFECQCGYHANRCMICPSLLACDLSKMAQEAQSVIDAGCDELHLDIMDGNFVPSISWGPPVISCLRKSIPDAYFDCHMMVKKPSQWVREIAKAGGDRYTFHLEAIETDDLDFESIVKLIQDANMKVGVAIKPGTQAEALSSVISLVDMVLVMTVEPGFGGQKFMPNMMPKVMALRDANPGLDIQVDGGLGPKTIGYAAAAGANSIVAGSASFNPKEPAVGVFKEMRAAVMKLGNGMTDEQIAEAMGEEKTPEDAASKK